MSQGIVSCFGDGQCGIGTVQARCVGAQLVTSGTFNTTNMLSWLDAFDITTVTFGQTWIGDFTDSSQTTPPSIDKSGSAGLGGSINNMFLLTGGSPPCSIAPITGGGGLYPVAIRGQVKIPNPTAYYILAWGTDMGSLSGICEQNEPPNSRIVAYGCTYPVQPASDYPMLVDIPVPDHLLETSLGFSQTVMVQYYYFGLIQPCSGYNPIWTVPAGEGPGGGPIILVSQNDLAGCTVADNPPNTNTLHMTAFGANWNAAAVCHPTVSPSNSDPFTGTFETP